jgi:hypothetical protein
MADPISAGVVGSVVMPTAGVALAAPTISTALVNGLNVGGSFFGQGGMLSQAGQGLSVFNQANQAFGGGDQSMQMAPQGQISRGQVQPMDYMSLLNPQNQQTVISPPQISLLG